MSGPHTIDAIRMLTSRQVEAVSGHLDLSGRPDCRGEEFQDPGGWGMLRMEGGLVVLVDAADYGTVPFHIGLNLTGGRIRMAPDGAHIERTGEEAEHWPVVRDQTTFMHGAVAEIVRSLDDNAKPDIPVDDAVRTLEAIVAFHLSYDRNAQWVNLPLEGEDRGREVKSG